VGSAGIGAASALAATAMQLRHSRLDRERGERAAWRDRAAAILGPVLGVLDDMEPRAIAERGGRSQQTLENIGRRWWRARDDLLVFSAANPSGEVATAGQALADAVAKSWTSMTSLNRALQADGEDAGLQRSVQALLDRACGDHDHAVALARELRELTRVSTTPGRA